MEAATKRSHHAEKVSKHVPQHAPHGNDALWSPLSLHGIFVCLYGWMLVDVLSDCRSRANHAEHQLHQVQERNIDCVRSAITCGSMGPSLLQQHLLRPLRPCLLLLPLGLPLPLRLLHCSTLHLPLTATSQSVSDGQSSLYTRKVTITPTSRSAFPAMSRACSVGSSTMSSIRLLRMILVVDGLA